MVHNPHGQKQRTKQPLKVEKSITEKQIRKHENY